MHKMYKQKGQFNVTFGRSFNQTYAIDENQQIRRNENGINGRSNIFRTHVKFLLLYTVVLCLERFRCV